MNTHKLHRIFGLIMLVPLCLWSATGAVFLIKPGYEGAYEKIEVRQYDIDTPIQILHQAGWKEIQVKRSILGMHLLVNDRGTWRNLNPETYQEDPYPQESELTALINDAISVNKERYGNILEIRDRTIVTDTGVELNLDWSRMSLRQQGEDTRLISTLYQIHYLQWFDSKDFNKVFGNLGLFCLIALTVFGLVTYLRGRKQGL